MISSLRRREDVQLAVYSLALVGCPVTALLSLWAASYCFWMTSYDLGHPAYWGLWMLGFAAAGLASLTLLLWLLIAPLVRGARRRRSEAARLSAVARRLRAGGTP